MATSSDSIKNSNSIFEDGAIDFTDVLPHDDLIDELKFVPVKPAPHTSDSYPRVLQSIEHSA